jgi:hypothetical protein
LQSENSNVPKPKKQINNNGDNEPNAVVKIQTKLPTSKPEYAASAPKAERNFVDPDSPVKKPRHVRRGSSSNIGVPLFDRNATGKSDESVSKEPENFEDRRRPRQKRTQEEKENNRR